MKNENITEEEPREVRKRLQRKKLVAWVVRHCVTDGKRENYFKELRKHVQADKYSKCRGGNKKCPLENCLEIIASEYKFYFAAENSICKGYITEKLFGNALKVGMVPIVYGGANYSQILPPHSFIDVKDFASPKDLATYLNKLANDDDLYNEYFAWRKKFQVVSGISDCDICKFLHSKSKVPKVYNDLTKFWTAKDCISGQDFLNSVLGDNT